MRNKMTVLLGLFLLIVIGIFLYTVRETPRDQTLYQDGVHTGTGTGYGGEIVVEVAVDRGHIVRITVLEHQETEAEADSSLAEIQRRILVNRGPDGVDTVSGATETSIGVIEAVEDALRPANSP